MVLLFRFKDNNCYVEESEKVLKKKEKFSEFIILYEKKGLYEKGNNVFFLEMIWFIFLFLREINLYVYKFICK